VESFLSTSAHYLLSVLLSTLNQLFILLGPLLILAIMMHFVSTGCQNLGYRLMGNRIFLGVFGWLGTAVHELGHALFAILFFHKITDMQLFSPDQKKGTLGYVNHTWNSSNLYQVVGNFFIGIGPVLMGSITLFLVSWLLFSIGIKDLADIPMTVRSFSSFASTEATGIHIYQGFIRFIGLVFAGPETSWWKLVLFLYLTYAIGSSITLSPADIKGALKGFLVFVILLLIFNLLTIWIGTFTTGFFAYISTFFSGFYFLLLLSIVINLAFMVVLLILIGIRSWILKRVDRAG
jgi:hypothetical protein